MSEWNFPLIGPQNEVNQLITVLGLIFTILSAIVFLIAGFVNEDVDSGLSKDLYGVGHNLLIMAAATWVFGMFAYLALFCTLLVRSIFKKYNIKWNFTKPESTSSRSN